MFTSDTLLFHKDIVVGCFFFPGHGVFVIVPDENGLDLEHGGQASSGGQTDEPEVVEVKLDVVKSHAGRQWRRLARG